MQIAGGWRSGWNRKSYQTERRNGPFGFCAYTMLYAIEAPAVSRIKFGVTSNVEKRLRQLQGASPTELHLLGYVWMPDQAEPSVFEFLKDDRIHGEWFVKTERVRSVAALIAAKLDLQLADALQMNWLIPETMIECSDGIHRPK